MTTEITTPAAATEVTTTGATGEAADTSGAGGVGATSLPTEAEAASRIMVSGGLMIGSMTSIRSTRSPAAPRTSN